MGILIEGMDMPKSCLDCYFSHAIAMDKRRCDVSNIDFYLSEFGWGTDNERRLDNCPLVEVKAN